MFLVWWYKSQPVFWLPKGWFPYPLVWILSFPSAPIGEYPYSLHSSLSLLSSPVFYRHRALTDDHGCRLDQSVLLEYCMSIRLCDH